MEVDTVREGAKRREKETVPAATAGVIQVMDVFVTENAGTALAPNKHSHVVAV
jgi:hypothetical protein